MYLDSMIPSLFDNIALMYALGGRGSWCHSFSVLENITLKKNIL